MMYESLLGSLWSQVRNTLDAEGVSYVFEITYPPSDKVEFQGELRIVRVRQKNNKLELVLAHDKFLKK